MAAGAALVAGFLTGGAGYWLGRQDGHRSGFRAGVARGLEDARAFIQTGRWP